MLRKGQWLTAAALAAALILAAQPLSAAGGARTDLPRKVAALRVAWETLVHWWGKVAVSGPPQCEPGETEGSGCIDPDGATTSGNPPQCAPGETEDSCGVDPNG